LAGQSTGSTSQSGTLASAQKRVLQSSKQAKIDFAHFSIPLFFLKRGCSQLEFCVTNDKYVCICVHIVRFNVDIHITDRQNVNVDNTNKMSTPLLGM
jgi:hypothetical protein